MPNRDVQAMVVPPVGWSAEPLKSSDQHTHQVWISPSRNTAYGVIYFSLPLPVGQDLTLWGFLQQMQKTEGRANLLSKEPDDQLPGLRFVAEGMIYTVRTNLIVSGFHGWAIYAGTINQKPVDDVELLDGDSRPRTNPRWSPSDYALIPRTDSNSGFTARKS